MTMTDGWDDARLSTAYTAMTVARPTPAGLEARTVAALRAPTTGPRRYATALTRLPPAASSIGVVAIALILVATLTIWDASEDGVAPLPEREQSLRWPPRGAEIVEMPFDDGPGRPPVHVAVIDKTGQLVEARAVTSAEIAVRDITTNAVGIADLPGGGVLVDWGGSTCDDLLTLTISASDAGIPQGVTVDGRRGSPCRLVLVYYAVVLTFDPPVAADDLAGRYLIGP